MGKQLSKLADEIIERKEAFGGQGGVEISDENGRTIKVLRKMGDGSRDVEIFEVAGVDLDYELHMKGFQDDMKDLYAAAVSSNGPESIKYQTLLEMVSMSEESVRIAFEERKRANNFEDSNWFGMGIKLGGKIAMKCMDITDEESRRYRERFFKNEFETISKFSRAQSGKPSVKNQHHHPLIVQVCGDIFTVKNLNRKLYEDEEEEESLHLCYFMECCSCTLDEVLFQLAEKKLKCDFLTKLLFIIEVLEGIVHIHREGMMHRDLTMGNLMFLKNEAFFNKEKERVQFKEPVFDVRIIDFDRSTNTKYRRGGPLASGEGIDVFTAPEILRNQNYDNRCDIWSIGMIIMMVMFELPFRHFHPMFKGSIGKLSKIERTGCSKFVKEFEQVLRKKKSFFGRHAELQRMLVRFVDENMLVHHTRRRNSEFCIFQVKVLARELLLEYCIKPGYFRLLDETKEFIRGKAIGLRDRHYNDYEGKEFLADGLEVSYEKRFSKNVRIFFGSNNRHITGRRPLFRTPKCFKDVDFPSSSSALSTYFLRVFWSYTFINTWIGRLPSYSRQDTLEDKSANEETDLCWGVRKMQVQNICFLFPRLENLGFSGQYYRLFYDSKSREIKIENRSFREAVKERIKRVVCFRCGRSFNKERIGKYYFELGRSDLFTIMEYLTEYRIYFCSEKCRKYGVLKMKEQTYKLLRSLCSCCGVMLSKENGSWKVCRCKGRMYCQRDCQEKDWKRHKPECKKWQKERYV